MRDDEFKSVMEQLMIAGKSDIVDFLIQRDKKQRNTLERMGNQLVRLSKDTREVVLSITGQRDILADYCRRADKRANLAEVKLAEAEKLLGHALDWCSSAEAYEAGREFLARRANSEKDK